MSERLPALTGREVIRALERAGFTVVRITSSHHRLLHRDNPSRATTVPVHAGKTLKRGTMPGTAPATVAKQQHQTIGFET